MNNFLFETIQTDAKANFKFKSGVKQEYSYGLPQPV